MFLGGQEESLDIGGLLSHSPSGIIAGEKKRNSLVSVRWGSWKQAGRGGPAEGRGRMSDVGAQGGMTGMRKKCAQRVDGLIYMKGIICPADKTKVGVGREF